MNMRQDRVNMANLAIVLGTLVVLILSGCGKPGESSACAAAHARYQTTGTDNVAIQCGQQ